MKEHEMTKIINALCQDCNRPIRILANETAVIVSIQCPDCTKMWQEKNFALKRELETVDRTST